MIRKGSIVRDLEGPLEGGLGAFKDADGNEHGILLAAYSRYSGRKFYSRGIIFSQEKRKFFVIDLHVDAETFNGHVDSCIPLDLP